MNSVVAYLVSLLLYPGGLFLLVMGWLLCWLRDGLLAWRRGEPAPRLLQGAQDVLKLFGKSASFPSHSALLARVVPGLMTLAPWLALVLTPVPGNLAFRAPVTTGDLLAVVLLLVLPMLAPVLLGYLIHSPNAQIAAQRATHRTLALLAGMLGSTLAVAAARGSLDLGVLAAYQAHPTPLGDVVDVLAGLLFCACLPALLGQRPWGWFQRDLELLAGPFTDLAGSDLALVQLGVLGQQVAASSVLAVLYIVPFVPGGVVVQVLVYLAVLLGSAALAGLARGAALYSFAR
jgi:formate hydrogenlyase subunit 4